MGDVLVHVPVVIIGETQSVVVHLLAHLPTFKYYKQPSFDVIFKAKAILNEHILVLNRPFFF